LKWKKQIKFTRERNDSKMQILKKNQVIIFVIALMFVAAGYLSFTSNNAIPTAKLANSEEMAAIGDATLVNANVITEEITEEKENKPSEEPVIGTSVQITQDEYFSQSRLDRDTMYSQMIESYQKILESDNVTTEQKNIAQQEISKINELKNSIMIAENLIKTKGFEDLIIFVNNKSVNIIVKAGELKPEQIAQIQNVTNRELGVEIENIHISNKN
jgi:mutants block sporulation after engulfment